MRKFIKKHPRASLIMLLAVMIGGQAVGVLPIAQFSRLLTRPLSIPFTKLGLGVSGAFGDVLRVGKLSNENEQLHQANAELKAQIADLREVATASEQLRAQLSFGQKSHLKSQGADVIAYQPDDIRRLILINKGSRDGVKSGQPVMVAGYLIGVTKDVFNTTAEVMLVTDPDFRALTVTQSSRAPGIVKGFASNNVAMERIPQNHVVQTGETIITSGLDGSFPIGLPVGEVAEIQPSAEAIFQTARLKTPVNLGQLRVVSVLTGE